MLSSFIRFLEEGELLDFSTFNFDTRLRIQKYVYLSRRFGLEWEHSYNMYRYGPYSTSLAEEYYGLHKSGMPESATELPASFRINEFMNLVDGRSSGWLEIAATLIDQRIMFYTHGRLDGGKLVRHVESIKHDYTVDFINSVFNDLVEHNQLLLEMPSTTLNSSSR